MMLQCIYGAISMCAWCWLCVIPCCGLCVVHWFQSSSSLLSPVFFHLQPNTVFESMVLILARNDYWPDLSDTLGTTPSWPGLKPGLEPNLGCRTRPKVAAPTPEQQRSRMPSCLAFHSLRALCTFSYLVFKIKEDASFCVTLYQAQCKK